jgi:RNA polymerase sigma factor (TIGR02999 family)
MKSASPEEVTQLLKAWREGDEIALNQLIPLVDGELKRIARGLLAGEKPNHTLQTTALINEAYLEMVGHPQQNDWANRAHFFGVAAIIMRHILTDHARKKGAIKRGKGASAISLEEAATISVEPSAALVALDDALGDLEKLDKRKSRVVELRFFGGLSVEETAEVLKIAAVTVMRDWDQARAWLLRELTR